LAHDSVEVHTAKDYLDQAAKFYNNQQYIQALNFSKKALNISIKNNDEYHLALSYNLIGSIYNEFSQTERSLKFYTKALAYANNVDNDTLRLWVNSNIGSVYYYHNINFDKTIKYYSKSLEIAEKLKDSLQITFIRINIANAYFEIDKIDLGIKYVEPLRNYIENKENVESKINYFSLLAKYNSLKNNDDDAEIYFLKAIKLAKENSLNIQLYEGYQNLSEHYYGVKKINEADRYKKLAKKFKLNFKSEENLDSIEQMAVQIELDEYKFQFEQIELKNELQNQKIRESRIFIISISVILFILLILIYSLYRNITTRKKNNSDLFIANQELIKAKILAEENSSLKSQFISTISHELRTPLYGVIGMTNIILEENKDIVSQENLHSLRFSAQYLLALVNDLLEINKAEEKKIILKNAPFNLEDEMKIIKNSLTYMADGNGNKLNIEIDQAIPKILVADKLRLSQIMMNLISNALKFTENGSVNIAVKLIQINDKNCQIEMSVSDTGIGIKKENQHKIFDNFVQIERKVGDYQGTGLGLPIVKKLVTLFGGIIKVESTLKKGSKFSFNIQLDYLNEQPSNTTLEMENNNMEKEIRVLIVEDNKINQIVTKKIIERRNYPCTIVENGFEALEILKATAFDIILMDINMPKIDGYETSKSIRELGIEIPIIALTAFDRSEVETKAKECGISDIIIKPFSPEILFEIMDKLLNSK
jgi:signal transduction histidine kinase/CheY-like chemotaxis protein